MGYVTKGITEPNTAMSSIPFIHTSETLQSSDDTYNENMIKPALQIIQRVEEAIDLHL